MSNAAAVEAYNKREIREITRVFKAMEDEAAQEANEIGYKLAKFAVFKIQAASHSRGIAASRIADRGRAAKKSRIGEFSFGFATTRFSGGGTGQFNYSTGGGAGLLAGLEFGSREYSQFPSWSGTSPSGRGSRGYFIYPTLRAIQPSIVESWQESFSKILDKWG